MSKLLVALIAAVSLSSQSQRVSDLAVFNVLQHADSSLTELTVWHRVPVTSELDLVLVMGTPKTWSFGGTTGETIAWGKARQLALFLQARSNPGQVFTLAIEAGVQDDCAARILRATVTDTVISCRGEKRERYPNQKFVYDVRAKRLVGRFSYAPFLMYRARTNGGGAVIVGTDGARRVNVDFVPGRVPEFRIVTLTDERQSLGDVYIQIPAAPTTSRRFGPSGAFRFLDGDVLEKRGVRELRHRLPVSTCAAFRRARPAMVQAGNECEPGSLDETVGPWQLEGDTLWFGKTFYGGEGQSGIGGLGYFDVVERKYRLFTSPLIAGVSVSAIHVEPAEVWVALVHRGEWGDGNVGVVRFDRQMETFQTYPRAAETVQAIVSLGEGLVLATDGGISVISENSLAEYFVDRTTDGRLRIAPLDR